MNTQDNFAEKYPLPPQIILISKQICRAYSCMEMLGYLLSSGMQLYNHEHGAIALMGESITQLQEINPLIKKLTTTMQLEGVRNGTTIALYLNFSDIKREIVECEHFDKPTFERGVSDLTQGRVYEMADRAISRLDSLTTLTKNIREKIYGKLEQNVGFQKLPSDILETEIAQLCPNYAALKRQINTTVMIWAGVYMAIKKVRG